MTPETPKPTGRCPWCRGDYLEIVAGSAGAQVRCNSCDACGPLARSDHWRKPAVSNAAAVAAWDRRAATPGPGAISGSPTAPAWSWRCKWCGQEGLAWTPEAASADHAAGGDCGAFEKQAVFREVKAPLPPLYPGPGAIARAAEATYDWFCGLRRWLQGVPPRQVMIAEVARILAAELGAGDTEKEPDHA
jgi:hypothetical protein